jgi:Na+-transporting methylmalonyl-CoA/oxaloacetate decarboxylase gamma subunit
VTDEIRQKLLDAGVYTVQSIQSAVESGEEIQIDDEVLMAGIESWKSALEDIGTVEGITGDRVEVTDDGYTIYINIDGTDHDAEAVMDVDKKMTTFTNIAVNVKYSKMELVQQAGLNTLLGMGVTFSVLIILIGVISMFNLIPYFQERRRNKAAAAAAVSRSIVKEADEETSYHLPSAEEELEDLTDDLALVAVISAAIAAYEGQTTTDGFVVRSIRKARRKRV